MDVLDGLAAWPGAVWLQGSGVAYLLVNAAHILGIALLIGAILPLDLSIAAPGRRSLASIGPLLLRSAAVGLTLVLVTGLWLFSVKPREYLANPAFLAKLALLGFALGNIAVQHRVTNFRDALKGEQVSLGTRLAAGVSAGLWVGVLIAGRWIGFV